MNVLMILNGHSPKTTLIFSECRRINIVVMRRKEPYKRGKIISSLVSRLQTQLFLSTLGTIFSPNAISHSTYFAPQDGNLTCQPMRAFLETSISIEHLSLSLALESSSTTLPINDLPLPLMALMVTTSDRPWNTIGAIKFFFLTRNPHETVSLSNGFRLRSLFPRLTKMHTYGKQQTISYRCSRTRPLLKSTHPCNLVHLLAMLTLTLPGFLNESILPLHQHLLHHRCLR